jgi:hypothetical protein
MKTLSSAIFVLIILFFISCKKEVADGKTEFIGHWYAHVEGGDYVTLDISEDSKAGYTIHWHGTDNHHDGKVYANDEHLKIGSFINFKVINYPHLIDSIAEPYIIPSDNSNKKANWKMTLKGPNPSFLFVHGTWDYYKAVN